MLLKVLFPQPYAVEVSKRRQQLDEAHLAWSKDPHWNKRIFSVQAAHDGETWSWSGVHVVAGWGVLSI